MKTKCLWVIEVCLSVRFELRFEWEIRKFEELKAFGLKVPSNNFLSFLTVSRMLAITEPAGISMFKDRKVIKVNYVIKELEPKI